MRPRLQSTLLVPKVNLMPAALACLMKAGLGSWSRLLISMATPLRAAASMTFCSRSGVHSCVVLLGQHVGQIGRIDVDVDRLVVEDVDDRPHQQLHERLLVRDIDLVLDPEPGPSAAMVDDRHGVGEDVIELGDGLLGEQPQPLAAFGLHADEDRLALEAGDVALDAGVVGDGELQPAVGGNAVLDAVAAAEGHRLFGASGRP